tara:strand:+ start:2414 stop:2548 length:135 start_codon:yes stop_codon:yes gene_type:complete
MAQDVQDLIELFIWGWGASLLSWVILRAVYHARQAAQGGFERSE